MNELSGKQPDENETIDGTDGVVELDNSGELSGNELGQVSTSDEGLSDSAVRRKKSPRLKKPRDLAIAVRGHAAQRQLERERNARDKAALAEFRRLDEELNKLDRRLEVIELDFRKLFGAARGMH